MYTREGWFAGLGFPALEKVLRWKANVTHGNFAREFGSHDS
jgi:hypothetical protein